MSKKTFPSVAVCLAAYNGMRYLPEQLNSILTQQNVTVSIFISVDQSNDGTEEWLNNLKEKNDQIVLLPYGERFGNASKNFFRLLRDVSFDSFEYIAFADQDDFWLPKKLINAISNLSYYKVDAYSSNAIALWSNGKKKLIIKSQQQREFDYAFESAGPGCTFVINKKLGVELQGFITKNQSRCNDVALHDWFIYAFARTRGYQWFIDNDAFIFYRQHENNVVGANIGIKAKINRWKKMRDGWHIIQAILIADILGYSNNFPIRELKTYSFLDRFKLIFNVRKLRRRLRDRIALALFLLLPKHRV